MHPIVVTACYGVSCGVQDVVVHKAIVKSVVVQPVVVAACCGEAFHGTACCDVACYRYGAACCGHPVMVQLFVV